MLTIAVILNAWIGLSSATPQTISAQDIRNTFGRMIAVRAMVARGDTLYSTEVVSLPADDPLRDFVSTNRLWLSYLVDHGHSFNLREVGSHGLDSAAVTASFAHLLTVDSAFSAVVLPAAARYLRSRGWAVSGVVNPSQRRVIHVDKIIPVAVRFFYPDILTPTGINTHICTQLNAVRALPQHDIVLEAFLFQAIMRDAQTTWTLGPDFRPASALMNRLDAPGPEAERLNRAQGVMWGAMARSSRLRQVIFAEAKRAGVILPFVVKL
jgi:hypothetical protein